ncbi:MAG TPA: NAD(+)/NADH kinase [Patescibacteria group bacterium]
MKKIEDVKWIGVALRPKTPELVETYKQLKVKAEELGIKVMLIRTEDVEYQEERDFDEVCRLADVLISLGGDGTFLSLARKSIKFQKPLLGIHYGKLGFLAETKAAETERTLIDLKDGNFGIKERLVIEAIVKTQEDRKLLAVNELVFKSIKTSGIASLKLFIKDKYINSYFGDGLIAATPTGSTAYNLSAGGPILYPFAQNIILTPIASHSLSQRPLVLPIDCEKMEIKIEDGGAVIVADGQEEIKLKKGTAVEIRKYELPVKVAWKEDRDFFGVLREKLNWGDHR